MELQIQAFKPLERSQRLYYNSKGTSGFQNLTYISTFCDDSTIVKLSRIARYAHANIFCLYKEYKSNQVH